MRNSVEIENLENLRIGILGNKIQSQFHQSFDTNKRMKKINIVPGIQQEKSANNTIKAPERGMYDFNGSPLSKRKINADLEKCSPTSVSYGPIDTQQSTIAFNFIF